MKGVVSYTVDTYIYNVNVNSILLVIVKIPVEIPKVRGELAMYNVPLLKYNV